MIYVVIILIFGMLFIGLSFFLLGMDISILIKGKRVVGEICGIEFHGNYGMATPYFIEVQFKEKGQDIKLITTHNFTFVPIFEKLKLSRRRRKLIGRKVHIYYIPDEKRRVLLREYLWKEFLAAAFMFFIGLIVVLSVVYNWY